METMQEMQRVKDQKAAEERLTRIRIAEDTAKQNASLSRASALSSSSSSSSDPSAAASAPRKYVFTAIEELPIAVDELRLNSGVLPASSAAAGGGGGGGGLGVMTLMGKGGKDAAAVDPARFPSCAYPSEGDDSKRLKALQIICMGGYDFSTGSSSGGGGGGAAKATPKRLLREGPLAKLNRGGPCTYQFLLLASDLVYAEPALGKDRYEVHNAMPLCTLRFSPTVDPKVNPSPPASHFTIFTPAKSFVVAASDEASKVSRRWWKSKSESK